MVRVLVVEDSVDPLAEELASLEPLIDVVVVEVYPEDPLT